MPVSAPGIQPPHLWSCNLGVARPGNAGSVMTPALTPVFYEIQAPCAYYPLQAMRIRVTTLLAASTIGGAIYSVNYTSASTFSATLVASLSSAWSGAAAGNVTNDVSSAPVMLDFTSNNYYIGTMWSSATTLQVINSTLSPGLYGVFQYASTVANTTTWASTFTQAQVVSQAGATNMPWVALLTATGKFTL
jgi:hypothetical protein